MNLPAAEVARVGSAVVTTEAVRQAIARGGYNVFEEASARRGLEDAINFELAAENATQLGLDKDPELAKQIKELLVQKWMADKVDAALKGQKFTDAELKKYYDDHVSEFSRPALARGQVLTLFIAPGKESEAAKKAADVEAQLKLGQKFDLLVRRMSDDPGERISGGNSNWMVEKQASRRYPPEVQSAMFSLAKPGDISPPVKTPKAIYFVSLGEKRPGDVTPLEPIKAEVSSRLYAAKRQQLFREYCEALKKNIPVTVNEAELKKLVEPSKPGSGPPRGPVSVP